MKCQACQVDKLSKEFPPKKITENCKHPRLHCMRCVVAHVKEHEICPHQDCRQAVAADSEVINILQHTLDEMFRVYDTTYTPLVVPEGASQGIIQITVLNGDSMTVPYKPYWTILKLKQEIHQKLQHNIEKQKLLYDAEELKLRGENGATMHLSDYKIMPNTVIHLVILMFAIPQGFDHVVFDLYWGYPHLGRNRNRKRDYLDASCLLFSGGRFVELVDYHHKRNENSSIRHSGDVMDDYTKTGHHTIQVSLKRIHQNITHLFFTLSAWQAPTISRYPHPSLRFYEADKPYEDLCKTTFSHAKYSQAVVMCSLSRTATGWSVFESGQLTRGNAAEYWPIKNTIRTLISQGY